MTSKAFGLAQLGNAYSDGAFTTLTLNGWTITRDNNGDLIFSANGVVKAKLTSAGLLSAADDVAAFEAY